MTRRILSSTTIVPRGRTDNDNYGNNNKNNSNNNEDEIVKLKQPYEFPRRGNSSVVLSSAFVRKQQQQQQHNSYHPVQPPSPSSASPTPTKGMTSDDHIVLTGITTATTVDSTTVCGGDTNVASMLYPAVHVGVRKNSDRTSSTLSTTRSYGSTSYNNNSNNNDNITNYNYNESYGHGDDDEGIITTNYNFTIRTTIENNNNNNNNNNSLLNNSCTISNNNNTSTCLLDNSCNVTKTTLSTSGLFTPDSSVEYEKEPNPEEGATQFLPALDTSTNSNSSYNNNKNNNNNNTNINNVLQTLGIGISQTNMDTSRSRSRSSSRGRGRSTSQHHQHHRSLSGTGSDFVPSWDSLLATPTIGVEMNKDENSNATSISPIQRRPSFPTTANTLFHNYYYDAHENDRNIHHHHEQQQQDQQQQHQQQYNGKATRAMSTVSGNYHTRKVVAGRIAKLASMFSSRATIGQSEGKGAASMPIVVSQPTAALFPTTIGKSTASKSGVHPTTPHKVLPSPIPQPISPAQSSGSSAYVDWPGTQNKRGHTVTNQSSSYDDSSLSTGGPTPPSSSLYRTNQYNDLNNNREIQAAALREMRWNDDFDNDKNHRQQNDHTNFKMVTNNAAGLSERILYDDGIQSMDDSTLPQAVVTPSSSSRCLLQPNYRIRRKIGGSTCSSKNNKNSNCTSFQRFQSPTTIDNDEDEDDETSDDHNHGNDNGRRRRSESDGSNSSAVFGSDDINAAEYHLAAVVADAAQRSSKTSSSTSSTRKLHPRSSSTGSVRFRPQSESPTSNNRFGTTSTKGPLASLASCATTNPMEETTNNCWGSESSCGGGPSSIDESSIISRSFSEYLLATNRGQKQNTNYRTNKTLSDFGTSYNYYSNTTTNNNNNDCTTKKFSRYGEIFSSTSNVTGSKGNERMNNHIRPNTNRVMVTPPTEDALAANDRVTPPHRTFPNSVGYRGLLDKTKEVPSLLDVVDSDSLSSSKATSVYSGTNPGPTNLSSQLLLQQHQNHHLLYHQQSNNPTIAHQENDQEQSPQNDRTVSKGDRKSSPLGILRTRNVDYGNPVDCTETDSDVFDGISVTRDSDIFDNLSASVESPRKNITSRTTRSVSRGIANMQYPARIAEEDGSVRSETNNDDHDVEESTYTKRNGSCRPIAKDATANNNNPNDHFKLIRLSSGITTIQSSDMDYSNRRTASDFDEHLTSSEVSSDGYTRIPDYNEMAVAGTDRDSSLHGIMGNLGSSLSSSTRRKVARSLLLEDITTTHGTSEADEDSDSCDHSCSTMNDGRDNELSQYKIQTSQMKKLVNRYRVLSELFDSDMSLEEFENEEDEHKAFALFEMRSRIMEKDIERGLERRGGTFVVDDIVTTAYNRTSHRIRDAVIVCKAWRDGASVSDVMKASLLGHRHERTHYIRRRIRTHHDGEGARHSHNNNHHIATNSVFSNDTSTITGGSSYYSASTSSGGSAPQKSVFYWEPVEWLDDTDIMLFRCPSLGSRNMRGFEIFTIGDCQSILLKLTNERCMELRQDLNEATYRQIEAEEMLKEEGDNFHGEMTEVEIAYLSSMEEVKTISKKLVQAEQSFALVRDRIKKLINKYETILMKIEVESSIVTNDASFISDYSSAYWEALDQREREMWARRARRAEIRAEIAAREALLARQETRMIQEVKERELEALKQKLQEIQSDSSSQTASDRDCSNVLANALAKRRNDALVRTSMGSQINEHIHNHGNDTARTFHESKRRISDEKVQDVKQRFRERMAIKKRQESNNNIAASAMMMTFHQSSSSSSMSQQPQISRPIASTSNGTAAPVSNSTRKMAGSSSVNSTGTSTNNSSNNNKTLLFRAVGEEMFQQMDFYERSLHSVERTRL